MQETWVQSLGQEDPLERGLATHCSILAWEIPWTEEPGGLPTVHGVTKSRIQLSDGHGYTATSVKILIEPSGIISKTFHDTYPCTPHSRQALTRLTLGTPCSFISIYVLASILLFIIFLESSQIWDSAPRSVPQWRFSYSLFSPLSSFLIQSWGPLYPTQMSITVSLCSTWFIASVSFQWTGPSLSSGLDLD